MTQLTEYGVSAKKAKHILAALSTEQRTEIVKAMAFGLDENRKEILAANSLDLEQGRTKGLSTAMLDRLELNEKRIDGIVKGLIAIAALGDPVGEVIKHWTRPNGLLIKKVRVPIGVIGIIYESRPNVTADTASLCVRSGNAVILKGGSEAINSNKAIVKALIAGGRKVGMPDGAVQLIENTDREVVKELVRMDKFVDLIIPRGGEGLIRAVVENATVPVLKHDKGVCHVYVDKSADLETALTIAENAKCQRPGVCNATETLLLHQSIASEFLPLFFARTLKYNLEMRGDEKAQAIISGMKSATEEDWSAEYLDYILAVKIVNDVAEAVEHINHYGTHLSDAVVGNDLSVQEFFTKNVDSATVYVNASTRFTDGGEFGFGAEIGISTDKLHARGPMALEELTTYKYVISGTGQIRG